MMRGQVVMAPSRVDATGPALYDVKTGDKVFDQQQWIDGSRVYVDGSWINDCVAYDEDECIVLRRPRTVQGSLLPPRMVAGRKVMAVPRAQRF